MLSQEEINQYSDQGFLVVPQVMNLTEIAELKRAFDELSLTASQFNEDTFVGRTFFNMMKPCDPFDPDIEQYQTISGIIRRVTYPYLCSSILNRYRTHPALLTAVSQILGKNLVQVVNQSNFNPPKVGKGWGWHQDYRFRRKGIKNFPHSFMQTLLAVDECHAQNGGLRIIPKSDQIGPLELDKNPKEAESFFNSKLAITPKMNPGDVIFFNPYIIHGSTENTSENPRRVYINGYAKKSDCPFGMPVLINGKISSKISGTMEYEYKKDKLKLASKY